MSPLRSALRLATVYRRCLPLFWNASPTYTLILLIITPAQGVAPAVGIVVAENIVNTLVYHHAAHATLLLMAWVGVMVLSSALGPLVVASEGALSELLMAQMTSLAMEKSKELPFIDAYERPEFYDDISMVRDEGAWRPVNLLLFSVDVLRSGVTLISVLILLGAFEPWLVGALLLFLIPYTIVAVRLQHDAFETMVWKTPAARRMEYYSSLLLNHEYAKEVRLYGLTDTFVRLFKQVFGSVFPAVTRARFRQSWWAVAFMTLAVGIGAAGLWEIIHQASRGTLLAGSILVFVQSILMAQQMMAAMAEAGTMLYDTVLYMETFFRFLDRRPSWPVTAGVRRAPGVHEPPLLEFADVMFAYPNSGQVLNGVSFTVRPREKVAIVGENGAGKSTIVKLLLRMYEPSCGAIRINGIDIREYDLEEYRRLFSVLFQDFAHYEMTAGDNVGLGNVDRLGDVEGIVAAAKRAGVHNVVEALPHGYGTQLGTRFEGGTDLSGGEWQMLSLARAIYRPSSVVVLDEPTAAIDPLNEDTILRGFMEAGHDKSMVIISHRLSTVRLMDRILVISDGRVQEQGDHEALLTAGGLYHLMFTTQARRFSDG